jgi:hypothetical protein
MVLAVKKLPGYLEKASVLGFVGAASSRDRFNSRLPPARRAYAPEGKPFPLLGRQPIEKAV